MNVQVIEMVVKCSVPRDEAEDYIYRFRSGQKIVGVPEGLTCQDAFETDDVEDAETVVIRAGYNRRSYR